MTTLLLAALLHTQPAQAISWKHYWLNVCERYLAGEDPYQYEFYSNYQLWVEFERLLQNEFLSPGILGEARRRLPLATGRDRELLLRILRE